MNERNRQLTIAFIRSVANNCTTCYHRGQNCDGCFSLRAKRLLLDIEADERPKDRIDYSIAFRMARIEKILKDAGRPLPSSRIDTRDICSKQLKHWTLRHLIKIRRIYRTRDPELGCYVYYTNKKETKNEHRRTHHQGCA